MAPTPDLRAALARLLAGLSRQGRLRALHPGRRQRRSWDSPARQSPRHRARPGHLDPRTLGSALVQALMFSLVAVIGAFLMASRLTASRFNSFSRNDTEAAREIAEFGLNEIQTRLNTNEFGHLWVTKFRDSNGNQYKDASGNPTWGNVTAQDLADCGLAAQDSDGKTISTPGVPAGISSERVIRNTSEGKLAYQVTDFTPPVLPDNLDTTTAQSDFCTTPAVAREFGNMNGGSALLTVTGTVTTRNGVTSSFKLRRRTSVIQPAADLKYSFMILGDATPSYIDAVGVLQPSFGASADIAKLNRGDGNICYGTNINTTCFTTPPLPTTVVGCYNLQSCLVNNVDSLTTKERLKNCSIETGKKKTKGYICSSYQQAGPLPSTPTPTSEGFLKSTGTAYASSDWATFAVPISCDIKNGTCDNTANKSGSYSAAFPPYKGSKIPTSLTNASLIDGCYFNNIPSQPTSAPTKNTTAINCLFSHLTIYNADSKGKKPNLVFNTSSYPVNIFLLGSTSITLNDGGIDNSATGIDSWQRLRIYGKEVATTAGKSVSCSQSSSITSTSGNDINNLFLWLPNAALNYSRSASTDNSYVVIWVCEFTGPTKDSKGNRFSIVTPIPEKTIRQGLTSTIGPRFQNVSGTYRGRSSEDTPVP